MKIRDAIAEVGDLVLNRITCLRHGHTPFLVDPSRIMCARCYRPLP